MTSVRSSPDLLNENSGFQTALLGDSLFSLGQLHNRLPLPLLRRFSPSGGRVLDSGDEASGDSLNTHSSLFFSPFESLKCALTNGKTKMLHLTSHLHPAEPSLDACSGMNTPKNVAVPDTGEAPTEEGLDLDDLRHDAVVVSRLAAHTIASEDGLDEGGSICKAVMHDALDSLSDTESTIHLLNRHGTIDDEPNSTDTLPRDIPSEYSLNISGTTILHHVMSDLITDVVAAEQSLDLDGSTVSVAESVGDTFGDELASSSLDHFSGSVLSLESAVVAPTLEASEQCLNSRSSNAEPMNDINGRLLLKVCRSSRTASVCCGGVILFIVIIIVIVV